MLFQRRTPAGLWEKIRTGLLPRRSYGRSFHYFRKRVLRLSATPHAIAAGVAAGVFASFTPFLGFHILLAFALAYVLAGNMVAAAIGTVAGNPLTFPLIFSATFRIGRWLLGGPLPHADAATPHLTKSLLSVEIAHIWDPILKPMLLGAIPLGTIVGLITYVLVRSTVSAFRHARAVKLAQRRREKGVMAQSQGSAQT